MTRSNARRAGRMREKTVIRQLPWRRVGNPFPPVEVLRPEQVDAIHDASMRILEEMGIEIMSGEARSLLRSKGAHVDEATAVVRFDRGLIADLIRTAPECVTLTPRNADHAVTMGGDAIVFGLVAGPPNVHDRVNGRRNGNRADYRRLLSLAQSFNIIHLVGNQPIAPVELPAETRHLDCYHDNVVYTDRAFHCTSVGRDRAMDGIDIMALSRGITREQMRESPGVTTIISVNSPRRLDEPLSEGLMTMSEWGQCVCVTPFTLMGAMTPVTLAAALAQQNAEALAGIALTQAVRPGAPVIYGAFTSNVDMRSGAPTFGTPENAKATMAAGQLARRYRLPYRSSNACTSNAADAQAVYESQMSIWASVMGHSNLLYHGAGWLEGGLTASFEKIVMDAEMLQQIAVMLTPIPTDEASLGLEAIRDVAPGGHFFGSPHTMERYEEAFYTPFLSDWRNYGTWEEAGAVEAEARATRVWQALLEAYEPPAMPADRLEALEAFVARRKEELSSGV